MKQFKVNLVDGFGRLDNADRPDFNSIRQQSRLPGAGLSLDTSGNCIPPAVPLGHINNLNLRLNSEIPNNRTMEPPACVQNAMMKQDKKPFTYTPGGIDLSEIKSPRMARRIERNANYDGAPESALRSAPGHPPPPPHGPLPPSALAAMQPQMHVQVFPSGPAPPPPMSRGGIPPPPPPMTSMPPPPPPPMQPLPTQKVTTSENLVLERPDMTRIIPDNPMALLRKTGGPSPRATFLDEVYGVKGAAKAPPQQPSVPVVQRQPRSPPIQQPPTRWSTPTQQQPSPPIAPQHQYQEQTPPVQQSNQVWSPPSQQQNQQPQLQRQPQIPPKATPQQWSPPIIERNQPQTWSPPVIERNQPQPQLHQPQPQMNGQRQKDLDQPLKTSTAHLGSLYIPPAANQQPQHQPPHRAAARPPSPPKRDMQSPILQSPGTPTLKEAPKPWQKQPQQPQQELPPWARKENAVGPAAVEPELQPVQQTPVAAQQQRFAQPQVRPPPQQQFDQRPHQQAPQHQPQSDQPNIVFVTQPMVLQHPGSRGGPTNQQQLSQQQQQQWQQQQQLRQQQQPLKVDAQGAKIIPIQVEGNSNRVNNAPTTPKTPGSERSLNRQQSWGNNPTQSNAFRLIQKITNTDGDEEDEDQPIIEHPPKYPQQFQQQTPPVQQQMRKLQLADSDRELMNRFKQGVDDENLNLHNEVDPRYRGPAIPSKAFKLLQSMTDGSTSNSTSAPAVAHGSPGNAQNRNPQVRTIPIQIERDDQPQNYVPPSEQTVPEPKKYTGSSIPSRSFKILQAMTAPDSCANANEVNEINYDPSSYATPPTQRGGCDPRYPPPPPCPPYPPHFWHEYYYPTYYQNPQQTNKDETKNNDQTPRQTPVPFWGYPTIPPPYVQNQRPVNAESSSSDADGSSRNTPLPFWGHNSVNKNANSDVEPTMNTPASQFWGYYPYGENAQDSVQYPPYWDPYYYTYYYGYPPVYPPYPFYGYQTDSEDPSGHCSTDEMSTINRPLPEKDRNIRIKDETREIEQIPEQDSVKVDGENATPKILLTPANAPEDKQDLRNQDISSDTDNLTEKYSTDSDSDSDADYTSEKAKRSDNLQTIKSVTNIKIYENEGEDGLKSTADNFIVEENSEETDDNDDSSSIYVADDSMPHQLSVIYEVSERTDSSMRDSSILSDSTTVAEEKSDSEDSDEEVLALTLQKNREILESQAKQQDKNETLCYSPDFETSGLKHVDQDQGSEFEEDVFTVGHDNKNEQITKEGSSSTETVIIKQAVVENEKREEIFGKAERDASFEKDECVENVKKETSDEDEDWWGILKKDEDDLYRPKAAPSIQKLDTNEVLNSEENLDEARSDNSDNQQNESSSILENENLTVVASDNAMENAHLSSERRDQAEYDDLESRGASSASSSDSSFSESQRAQNVHDIFSPESHQEVSEIHEQYLEKNSYGRGSNEHTGKLSYQPHQEIEQIDDLDQCCNRDESNEEFANTEKNYSDKNGVEENVSTESNEGISESGELDSTNDEDQQTKLEILSIRERIEALKQSIKQKQSRLKDDQEVKVSVKEKITAIEEVAQVESQSGTVTVMKISNVKCSEKVNSKEQKCIEQNETDSGSFQQEQGLLVEQTEVKTSVKEKVTALEGKTAIHTQNQVTSTRSSMKSYEDFTEDEDDDDDDEEEEEIDSGVTSDVSRHISDNEEFPELKKMTRYQRAATHSRLFKLLQEECNEEDDDQENIEQTSVESGDKFSKLSVRQISAATVVQKEENVTNSREHFSLPLKNIHEFESYSSSGLTSPGSPVNDRLVHELVQSMLKRKKDFLKNVPKEKLHAAAKKILQEEMDDLSTPDSSFLSPLRSTTENSTPAQTPQEFYNDYKQYYDSWSEAERIYKENYDILPSKAFKLLQEHSGLNRTGAIAGLLAKCPKILSSKNVHEELLKLIEGCHESSSSPPSPEKSPLLEPGGVSNAS